MIPGVRATPIDVDPTVDGTAIDASVVTTIDACVVTTIDACVVTAIDACVVTAIDASVVTTIDAGRAAASTKEAAQQSHQ